MTILSKVATLVGLVLLALIGTLIQSNSSLAQRSDEAIIFSSEVGNAITTLGEKNDAYVLATNRQDMPYNSNPLGPDILGSSSSTVQQMPILSDPALSLFNTTSAKVLVDQGHNDLDTYNNFLLALAAEGYDIRGTTSSTITYDALVPYAVFIIPMALTPPSEEEILAIRQYVSNGGGLFLISDYEGFSAPYQALANVFGVTLDANLVTDPNDYVGYNYWVTYDPANFSSHIIMQGLKSLQTYASTSLEPGTATALVTTDDDANPSLRAIAAALNYGVGRVVIIGDSNYFVDDHNGLLAGDNREFGINITNWLAKRTIRLAGRITDETGIGNGDVTIDDERGHSTFSDSTGNYTLTVLSSGTYTITPEKEGFTFSPASLAVSVPPDVADINFQAAAISASYTLHGSVSKDGFGLSDVMLHIETGGIQFITVSSNSSGAYTVPNLDPGEYTITPEKSGYDFSPASQTITVPTDDRPVDFDAIPVASTTYEIRGTVRKGDFGLSGVTVYISTGGIQFASKTTSESGEYAFTDLNAEQYTLTVELSGYTFLPASQEITVPPNQTNVNFAAIAIQTAYSIQGAIIEDGFGLSGVTVYISRGGIQSRSTTTGIDGSYAFTNLELGEYSLSVERSGYTFSPASQEITVPPDQTGVDFAASAVQTTSSIQGVVTENGFGLAGVTVSISTGRIQFGSTTTGIDGSYAFTDLEPGDYSLSIERSGYTFSPMSKAVTVPPDQTGVDFAASAVQTTSSIRGIVTENGFGLAGVTVYISTGGIQFGSTTTDDSGDYAFTGLDAAQYTLSVERNGYTFSPASQDITVPPDQASMNFAASAVQTRYSIEGAVTENGFGLAGVTVSISTGGIQFGSTTTGIDGSYAFANLEPGDYSLSVERSGYTFAPASQEITVPPDQTGVDFAASAVPTTSSIQGVVTENGFGLAGVTVFISTGGIQFGGTTTGIDGSYAFTDLEPGDYSLSVERSGYTFAPASQEITVPPDQTGVDFAASAVPTTSSIQGVVTENGFGLAGVTVFISTGGIQFGGTTTGIDGSYAFTDLEPGDYSLSVERSGYTFSPVSRTVAVPPDQTSVNFAGTGDSVSTFSFHGVIHDRYHNPMKMVQITAGGMSVLTEADGSYRISGLTPGQYPILASKEGYAFSIGVFDQQATVSIPEQVDKSHDFVGVYTPIVFIPGMIGSQLRAVGETSLLWPGGIGTDRDALLWKGGGNIEAPDVIRELSSIAGVKILEQYGPLLRSLSEFYPEYRVEDQPNRRTENCDARQMAEYPSLFVFAYDWRQSNQTTAQKLQEYVSCIHKFYPQSQINIVAHSMGGLVARRYILSNPVDNYVDKMVTIGTPWLGAPKMLYVLEEGEFGDINFLIDQNYLQRMVEYYPGSAELLPSKQYFDLGGRPFVGHNTELDVKVFEYPEYIAMLDERYPKSDSNYDTSQRPGTMNARFHDEPGQDRWNIDAGDDIEYLYIVGQQSIAGTIGAVFEGQREVCKRRACRSEFAFIPTVTLGDGTVPLLSAYRGKVGSSPDIANISVRAVRSEKETDDEYAEHLGMTKNPIVQGWITQFLEGEALTQTAAETSTSAVPTQPAYYVTVIGAKEGIIENGRGQITGVIDGVKVEEADDTSYLTIGDNSFYGIIPATGSYTLTFATGESAVFLEIVKGTDLQTEEAIRYIDIDVAAGISVTLHIAADGEIELSYDSDADDIADLVIPPSVQATGSGAQDQTAPTISFQQLADGRVQLEATDAESGVSQLLYSFDGQMYDTYSGPFMPTDSRVIHAFADDGLGNRSPDYSWTLESPIESGYHLLLPLIPNPGP